MKKSLLFILFGLFLVLVPGIHAETSDDTSKSKNSPAGNNAAGPGSALEDIINAPFQVTQGAVGSVFDLGNIVVGGKRLGSPFSEFVAGEVSSTSVVTERDIELRGAQNIPEALEEVPGIILSDLVGNGEEPTLDFRGFNEGQDFVFLLDGVRLNEPKSGNINFPLIPVSLIDRIEVSRGGASFLYGEGAMGGVANIVGLFPKEKGIHSKITSLFGSFGEWGESFETSAKDERFGLFMTGDLYHTRGFRQNSSVEKEDFYSKFIWEISEKIQTGFTYLYANAHLDRSGSIRESRLMALGPEATERPRNFADLESHLGIVDYRFSPLDSVAVSGNFFLRKSDELTVANFATFETNDNEQILDIDTWGFTTQMDHTKDIFWGFAEGFLVGVDYAESTIDEDDFGRSKATLQRLSKTVDSQSKKEDIGVFSKFSVTWNDRVGTYYGVRYDNIRFQNTDLINTGNNIPSEVSKVSHSVGASYDVTQKLALSGSYSRSFRAPTLSDLYANPLFGGNPALKPEESSDTELGLKWKEEKFIAKTAFFMSHRVNEIGFDPNLVDDTHLFGRNSNFGKTERMGIETSMEAKAASWARLRASHTYTEALFKSNTNGGVEISGDHIPMVPRNRFTTGVLFQPFKDLDIDINMIAVSKQVLTNDITNDQNGRRLPAYTVFNAKTIYRLNAWELSFQVKNLLDERYESAGSLGAAPSVFNSDHTVEDNFFVPAPGRSYTGSASYYW